jgi:hypothetical protein
VDSGVLMSVLIRFKINAPSMSPPSYEEIAGRLAAEGRGNGDEYPEFAVWGDGSYPDSTVIEYHGEHHFVTALARVRRAIKRAGVEQYCTGGDLRLPAEPF